MESYPPAILHLSGRDCVRASAQGWPAGLDGPADLGSPRVCDGQRESGL